MDKPQLNSCQNNDSEDEDAEYKANTGNRHSLGCERIHRNDVTPKSATGDCRQQSHKKTRLGGP